jgi:hypothetical protein
VNRKFLQQKQKEAINFKPEKTIPLFSDHPFGVAKSIGTP